MDYKWFKKCLQKKNVFYRDFIKLRTKKSENEYKKYKNKLTTITRASKEEYKKIVDNNKNNVKGI